jgi:hypothetical protein
MGICCRPVCPVSAMAADRPPVTLALHSSCKYGVDLGTPLRTCVEPGGQVREASSPASSPLTGTAYRKG